MKMIREVCNKPSDII